MRHYSSTIFHPYELLPADIFKAYGERGLLAMDPRIIWTLDQLRKTLDKPITINDYYFGGSKDQRGYRNKVTVGARLSQHRFGRAVDFDIKGMTAEEFRSEVRADNFKNELTYITRIENGTEWVHLDCAGIDGTEIVFFNP